MRPRPFAELVERIRGSTPFTDDDRAVIAAIERLATDVNPATIRATRDEVRRRPFWSDDLLGSLAEFHLGELVESILPGLPLDDEDLDIRAWSPRKFVPRWQGDLFVRTIPESDDLVDVVVGSLRGARALAAMERLARARISGYSVTALDDEDTHAIHLALSEIEFDGVHRLDVRDGISSAIAVRMILHSPSLADYSGPLDTEIGEALATTAVRMIYAEKTDAGGLHHLAGARWLAELRLSCLDKGYRERLPALLAFPALAKLHVGYGDLVDDDIVLLSTISTLEELYVEQNRFGDRGGVALANMTKLRKLDLHETSVADATAIALAALPVLAELDLALSQVGVPGIRALAKCTSLRRLGLEWHLTEEMLAATKELACHVESNDYIAGGGALWGGGYMGP